MNTQSRKRLAVGLFYYTTLLSILVSVTAVILSIWDIGGTEMRNRILATWFTLAAGVWLCCLTGWLFSAAREGSEASGQMSESGPTPLGRALDKAKVRRSGDRDDSKAGVISVD